MTPTVTPQNTQTAHSTQSAAPASAPTIAARRSCNADGIGLSHYVPMDRKAAK